MAADAEVIINTHLAGARQVLAESQAISGSMREMGVAAGVSGAEMALAGRRTWLMNQALFTLRRLVYGTTLGVIALGIEVGRMGFGFDSAMQQARVALGPLGPELGGVNKELDYLFNFTKYTPFQFKDMTIAFRQMYGGMRTVGISGQEVNITLKSIADALSFTGRTSPAALNRVSVALQHMAFLGHLTGQTVNQLARDGLPIYAALNQELGLTGDQIHHIGQLGITPHQALDALNKYIESTPGYANAAYRQATHSLSGLFTTFKDNLMQTVGIAEHGFFDRIQGRIVALNRWFDILDARLRKTHSLTQALDESLSPRSHLVLNFWRMFAGAMHDLWSITRTFVVVLKDSRAVMFAILGPLAILRGLLWLGAHTTLIWVPALNLLIGYLIIATIYTKLYIAWQLRWIALDKLLVFWTNYLAVETFIFATAARGAAFGMGLWSVATLGYTRNAEGQFIALTRLETIVLRLRYAFIGLSAAELGWIGLLVLAIGTLVTLYFKWKAFHDAVDATASFIWNHWYILALVPLVGPILVIIRYFRDILSLLKSINHWANRVSGPLGGIVNAAGYLVPGYGEYKVAKKIWGWTGLQAGGFITAPGFFMVGERGPELIGLPRGAAVSPTHAVVDPHSWQGGHTEIIRIELDGRVLAEVVARHQTDVNARK